AGQQLGVVPVLGQQPDGFVDAGRALVVECCGDHACPSRASRMAAHTRSGVAGMAMSVIPSGARASTMALMTVGVDTIVPASPMPLTPSGLVGLGVTVWSSLMFGTSAAEGTQ